MKYYLFAFMVILGFAVGQESILALENFEENRSGNSINWIGQQDYVQEVEYSCDMRGRACIPYFYWKGYAFWLLEGNINEGSLITLSKATDVSNRDLLRFTFIDENSNLIKASFIFYHDDIIFTENN